jgi:protein TonB
MIAAPKIKEQEIVPAVESQAIAPPAKESSLEAGSQEESSPPLELTAESAVEPPAEAVAEQEAAEDAALAEAQTAEAPSAEVSREEASGAEATSEGSVSEEPVEEYISEYVKGTKAGGGGFSESSVSQQGALTREGAQGSTGDANGFGNSTSPGTAAAGGDEGTGTGGTGTGGTGTGGTGAAGHRILPPRPKAEITPTYPRSARKAGLEGTVRVFVRLDEKGAVLSAAIYASSGSQALDQAALDSLRRAQFAPATRDGRPFATSVIVPIRFQLDKAQ